MLDNNGFNLWADGYIPSVVESDEEGSYPFAGYGKILTEIYNKIVASGGKAVLDIGFGPGTLAARLYEQGCSIWGQDFSEKMIRIAKERMPEAKLYCGDFSEGLVDELVQCRYDAIIATYSLHHLTDEQKIRLLEDLLPLLNDGGCIYIGDVVFDTREELERNKIMLGDEWDDEEIYFVVDELTKTFPQMKFERFSFCAGLLSLKKCINS